MRTLNSKSGELISTVSAITSLVEPDDNAAQPCWYVDVARAVDRNDYKWTVGKKQNGKTEEYSFKASKVGNVNDEGFWKKVTGLDFVTELIKLYKEGGQKHVKSWVDNGCP